MCDSDSDDAKCDWSIKDLSRICRRYKREVPKEYIKSGLLADVSGKEMCSEWGNNCRGRSIEYSYVDGDYLLCEDCLANNIDIEYCGICSAPITTKLLYCVPCRDTAVEFNTMSKITRAKHIRDLKRQRQREEEDTKFELAQEVAVSNFRFKLMSMGSMGELRGLCDSIGIKCE